MAPGFDGIRLSGRLRSGAERLRAAVGLTEPVLHARRLELKAAKAERVFTGRARGLALCAPPAVLLGKNEAKMRIGEQSH